MSTNKLTIEQLAELIASRRGADPGSSYTAKLLAEGIDKCARKFGEEAVETIVAALSEDKAALRAEAADLMYHLLVLLTAAGIDLDDIYAELGSRAGVSGHDEKASRQQ